ncbi:MAG: tetratricopeptide repeat protein [Phycisphaerales bacterium]|nr:MAG: tetratricopeptide repeat protein [Phycisphaerales bacterium]
MARIVYATVLITLVSILIGCPSSPYLVPTQTRPPTVPIPPGATETDLVEEMAISRQAYQTGLEQLVAYYSRTGNNLKLEWARKELKALNVMTKYTYIIGPTPGDQRATTPIRTADDLFYSAQALEKSAGPVIGIRDKNKLRLALGQYEQLIKDYPSSDKIDDAAFQAGVILEELGDYMVALDYFRSAFKWDPETIYPARFKTAYILDKHLHRYAEALVLYNEALKTEARYDRHRQWKEFAEQRIRELQRLEEGEN